MKWGPFTSSEDDGVQRNLYTDARSGLQGYEVDHEPDRRPEDHGRISVCLTAWDAVLIVKRPDLMLPHVVMIRREYRAPMQCAPARARVSYACTDRADHWLMLNAAVILNEQAARSYLMAFVPGPLP